MRDFFRGKHMGAGLYGLNPVASLLCFMVTEQRRIELRNNLIYANRIGVDMISIDDTPEWREAFAAYNEFHSTTLKTSDNCSRCYNSVKEWLLQ